MSTTRTLALAALGTMGLTASAAGQTCPQTSAEVTHDAALLETFASAGSGGVVFDTVAQDLQLARQAGSVSAEITVASTSRPATGCAADFDSDGWDDYVGALSDGSQVGFWKNQTVDNYTPPGDWSNPSFTVTPKFTFMGYFESPALTGVGGSASGCADFNGDTFADFLLVEDDTFGSGTNVYRADLFLGHGDGTFDAAYPITADLTEYSGLRRDATTFIYDADLDGDLDFLLPTRKGTTSTGTVRLFVNSGGASPTFTPDAILLDDIPIGAYGATAVSYLDFNRDGERDLVVAGQSFNGLLMHYGISGGGFDPAITITDANWPTGTNTGAQVLFGGDFDLDGYNDLLAATNQGGGYVFLWRDGGAPDYLTNKDADLELVHSSFTDTDLGFAIDYDNDPANTPDFILIENSSGVFAFANRLYSQYVPCAELASGIVDLGALSTAQMVITAARVDPAELDPDGGAGPASITWSMSNEDPPNWQTASPCIDDPTEYCVAFPKPTGTTVRWRVEMCTNTAGTITPTVSEVKIVFDYTLAARHVRAGVVVSQGIAYVGGFEMPGDSGHFFAANANLDKTYWDAGQKLDGMSDSERIMYTTGPDGVTRVTFDAAGALTPELQATLGVADSTAAAEVVTWQRSARFGPAEDKKLGSVLTSTAAVLTPPQRPYYYDLAPPSEKSLIDAFMTAYANRPTLVLFGSKDGALHAVRTDIASIQVNDTSQSNENGKESWAFIPHRIANGFVADKTADASDNYPDGSPTLADVKIGGLYRTVAIVGSGNGGKGFVALDVTDSLSVTSFGPVPLWDYVPGGGSAGQATSKAAVIRVKISGVERFLAVMGTGMAFDNTSPPYAKGLDVEAVDIATGARVWRFQAVCPVSTNIIAFETDDDLELGSPTIDGYVDRVVFADVCGNIYKIDPVPAGTLTDDWITGMGAITLGVDPVAQPIKALFSVAATSIAEERPIVGTIGTRADETGRLVMYFGTGGLENFDVSKQNAFFSAYADTGEIRDQLDGSCTGPAGACDKFYGGVVVTEDQVLLTRAIDPPIATSSCDTGSADIIGLDNQDFSQQFVSSQTSAVVSSLFASGGAVYATTLEGTVIRVGTPAQPDATPAPPVTPPPPNQTPPVKRRTWRELLD